MSVSLWDWYTSKLARRQIGMGRNAFAFVGPALAVFAQWLVTNERASPGAGFLLWLIAIGLSWPLLRTVLDIHGADAAISDRRNLPSVRRRPAIVALIATAVAYFGNSDGYFTLIGVAAWIVAAVAWLAAFWQGDYPRVHFSTQRFWAAIAKPRHTLHVSRAWFVLGGILLVAAFFRFYQLNAIPPEMTSDHVEKLLDVNDLLNGEFKSFFPRNTGREPLQFYFAALLTKLLAFGPNFLTLKLTGAIAGLLTVPFVILLAREFYDDLTGWLAGLLVAVAFWPIAIARVGLRFPLNPLFMAPALWLLVRGLRRNSTNDFLLAGLTIALGLYGYSPFRAIAVVLPAALLTWLVFGGATQRLGRLLAQFGALGIVATAVSAPLIREAVQSPEIFWLRVLRSVSNTETELPGPPFQIFLENLWNALRMFNVRGDSVWVNTIPGMPVLGAVTGGLFLVGVACVVYRIIRLRRPEDVFVLGMIPVLLLPSVLSLAYPGENPSVVRAGAAIVVVYVIAALPLAALIRYYRRRFRTGFVRHVGIATTVTVIGLAAISNFGRYFREYPTQYVGSAQNASEIGQVVADFAHSIGTYDTVWVRAYPFWVDTRAVGMYAGRLGWDQVFLDNEALGIPIDDPRTKLFIVHRDDVDAQAVLRSTYPDGTFTYYHSTRPHHDFLMYLVPAKADNLPSAVPRPSE
ncbi:MAG: ArnT family glycosyltransferase [Anaerolineales bacterium]